MGVNWGQADDLTREVMPAVYAAQLVELGARFRVRRDDLLEGTGIGAAALDQPDARVSSLAIATLAARALHLTKEPGLGYYLGLQLKLSSHGNVGLAAMTAATLGDALRIAQRYIGLRDPHLVLEHYIEGDLAVLELIDVLPNFPLRVFTTEALCTAFAQIGRSLLGRPLSGFVDMAFPEPPYFQGFAHLLPGAVRFNQTKNRLLFPRSLLDESLPMSDPVAARQALSQCEAELERLGETSSLLFDIRRELRASDSFPSLEEVAERQRVSARTLKRRLSAHGTSFRQLTDELRRDRALVLLENPELTVERIAELLGYSDASNFQRAFRRWLGVSPAAFRESHVRQRTK
jgi:AraC-like DNA-binding protein